MKQYSLHIRIFALISSIALAGCNKESVVEGFVPVYKRVELSTPALLSRAGQRFEFNQIPNNGTPYFIALSASKIRYSSTTQGSLQTGDSLFIKNLVSSNNVQMKFVTSAGASISKYNKGDAVNFDNSISQNSYPVSFLIRKQPFTSLTYTSIKSFSGVSYNFEHDIDQYAAIKLTNTFDSFNYYIWIRFTPTWSGLLIKEYAFQTIKPLDAGK